MHQSREAHRSARPHHAPSKGDRPALMRSANEARGTHPQRVGNDVGVDVGNDVGSAGSPAGRVSRVARCVEQGCGACQRSSTRRRRVPSPPPTVAGTAWSPGRRSRANGRAGRACATPGCRTLTFDRRAARPAGTTAPRASLVASTPGEIPRGRRWQAFGRISASQPQLVWRDPVSWLDLAPVRP